MSTQHIDDGGPAFPNVTEGCGGRWSEWDKGMSLRDYFATKAMEAHLITDTVPGEACDALVKAAMRAGHDTMYHLALNAYEVADAMLKARTALKESAQHSAAPVAWYDANQIDPTLEFGARPPAWGGNWKPLYAEVQATGAAS